MRPGFGEITFARSGASTALRRALASSPLRLLTPRNHGHARWVYLSGLGGGLVDGDALDLRLVVEPGATAFVGSQGPSRAYRSPRGVTSAVEARVGEGALFVYLPDPLALFAGANLAQSLTLELARGASVLAWDVFTAGRVARGERWAFASFTSTLRIDARVHETLRLRPEDGPLAPRLGRFEAWATLIAAGPRLAPHLADLARTEPPRPGAALVAAASPLGDDALILRAAATSVSTLTAHLRDLVSFVPSLLGDDPLSRRP